MDHNDEQLYLLARRRSRTQSVRIKVIIKGSVTWLAAVAGMYGSSDVARLYSWKNSDLKYSVLKNSVLKYSVLR